MVERSRRRPQTSPTEDSAYDKALSSDAIHRADQRNNSFLYANCGLGLFPMEPVDFSAFAKGQLIAMAILVPAALALYMFSG